MSEALKVILDGIKNAKDEDGGELWMPVSWATREGAAYEIAVCVMKSFGDSEYVLMPASQLRQNSKEENLIAAAPDLLEALEALVSGQHSHPTDCPCPWCQARAAIKKARAT